MGAERREGGAIWPPDPPTLQQARQQFPLPPSSSPSRFFWHWHRSSGRVFGKATVEYRYRESGRETSHSLHFQFSSWVWDSSITVNTPLPPSSSLYSSRHPVLCLYCTVQSCVQGKSVRRQSCQSRLRIGISPHTQIFFLPRNHRQQTCIWKRHGKWGQLIM